MTYTRQIHYLILPDDQGYGLTQIYRHSTDICGHACYIDLSDGGFVSLSDLGTLTVGPFTTWDGPSGPAIDTISFMRASLVHDMLYHLIKEGLLPDKYRKVADKIMRQVARQDGMSWFRAWWTWAGVRIAGWTHT